MSKVPRFRSRRSLTVIVAVLVVVLAVPAVAGALIWQQLHRELRSESIEARLGDDRPERVSAAAPSDGTTSVAASGTTSAPTGRSTGGSTDGSTDVTPRPEGPLNILVMGSDTRASGDGGYGGEVEGARSDTTLLVHLSADRERVDVVSIPRDSVVDLPECYRRDGSTIPARRARFNEAFRLGGQACTVRAVEQLTDVRIDHYAVVDFAGFERIVDALGGVRVCLPEPVDDERAHVTLPAGCQQLDGAEALGYARARYSLGDGSDLARIDRQQGLMAALVDKVSSTSLLLRPDRVYRLLDAAADSLTTDPALGTLDDLRRILWPVRDVEPEDVTFTSVPVAPDPENPRVTVVWRQPAADRLWDALRHDRPIPSDIADGAADELSVRPDGLDAASGA